MDKDFALRLFIYTNVGGPPPSQLHRQIPDYESAPHPRYPPLQRLTSREDIFLHDHTW